MCPLCLDSGWVQAAPVEDDDTLDHRYVRNSYVGSFTPVPCFVCSNYRVFMKAS